MKSEQEQTRSQLALVAALAKNRGELDAATLERLLRLVGALANADERVDLGVENDLAVGDTA
jgi:hypothetical protein